MEFETDVFLKFLFSVVFVFLCCLFMMLYLHKILAFLIQYILRYLVLPSTTRVQIGGILVSPLSARVFIQNFVYQDANMSFHFVDGHVTFAFWDTWWGDPVWSEVRDVVLTENLKGMRCRVQVKFRWIRGVIVDVLREEKKICVRLEEGFEMDDAQERPSAHLDSVDLSEMESGAGNQLAECSASFSVSALDVTRSGLNLRNSLRENASGLFSPREGAKRNDSESIHVRTGGQANHAEGEEAGESAPNRRMNKESNSNETNSSSAKLFDAAVVQIRQTRGKVRVHLNGMGLCLYNATGNYRNIAAAVEQDQRGTDEAVGRRATVRRWALRNFLKRTGSNNENPTNGGDEAEMESQGGEGPLLDGPRIHALKTQQQLKSTRSVMQRFFAFIGAIEVELYASYIDIGGAAAKHPYFLHIGFKRAEAHNYLTQDGVPSVDLYRFVSEFTLENVNARWSAMKKEQESVSIQEVEKNTWRDSVLLMLRGTAPTSMAQGRENNVVESSYLISNYGTILDANEKEKSSIHIVFYRDATNVYAGEIVTDRSQLPRMGVEIFVDAPELSYGPWSHYSLMQVKDFFFPQTYRPLEPLKFELGQPRPVGGFEIFVEFLRDTNVTIPFKRKYPAPSPPFGICDSGRKGVMLLTLGKGSQYIQKPQFILLGEDKQCFESLLMGKNVWLATNGLQNGSTILAKMETMELFIDRLDDKVYNGRKLWNILPKLRDTELWWYMDYIPFFMDLIMDLQFVPQMYHGVELTTETFNTYDLFVKEFIPNVKRFEIFLDGYTKLHVNSNPQNVIFSDDANDTTSNAFLTLSVKGNCYFFMTLPSDTVLISSATEVERPFKFYGRNVDLHMSLPRTHPLYTIVHPDTPFAHSEEMEINGAMTVFIPNQTVPQNRNPIEPVTGYTVLKNFLDVDVKINGLRGFVTAAHIRTFLDCFSNLFDASPCVISPEELFWPPSKVSPQNDIPQNLRQKFNAFLQKDEPPTNNLEICITLCLLDLDATLQTSVTRPPAINLQCGKFDFAFIKQNPITDMSIILSPISGRFYAEDGCSLLSTSYISCGGATVSLIRHFGPMPLRPLFHGSAEVKVNSLNFEITVEEAAMLAHLADIAMKQFAARDATLLAEIELAETAAAYSAEHILSRSVHPGDSTGTIKRDKKNNHVADNSTRRNPNEAPSQERMHFSRLRRNSSMWAPRGPAMATSSTAVHEAVQRCMERGGSIVKVPLTEAVPDEITIEFQQYLDEMERSADMSKDYAVVTMLASIDSINGCARVGSKGYFALQLPLGIQVASSTLNDLSSTSRLSVALRRVALRGFYKDIADTRKETSTAEDDYYEVFHVETALCMRQYTAFPFDKGLEFHLAKQIRFVEENNVENLFSCNFPVPPANAAAAAAPEGFMHEPRTPKCASQSPGEPDTAPRATRHETPNRRLDLDGRSTVMEVSISGGGGVEPHPQPIYSSRRALEDPLSLAPPLPSLPLPQVLSGPRDGLTVGGVSMGSETPAAVAAFEEQISRIGSAPEIHPASTRSSTPSSPTHDGFYPAMSQYIKGTSERFHTCISLSDPFGPVDEDEEEEEEEEDDNESAGENELYNGSKGMGVFLTNTAFAADSSLPRGNNVDASPSGGIASQEKIPCSSNEPKTRQVEPFQRFLHAYLLHSSANDEVTSLKYNASARFGTQNRHHDRTNFFAPIPATRFFASMDSNLSPQYLLAQQMFNTDGVEAALEEDTWALRCADNSKRIREGATSRHIHVEAIAPLTFLFTRQFVEHLYFDTEARIFAVRRSHQSSSPLSQPAEVSVSMGDGNDAFMSGPATSIREIIHQHRHIRSKERSRNREQQKRWLSEVKVTSVVLPCIEAKILTDLSLPLENTVGGITPDGVYTTTIGVRSFQFVLQRYIPPVHVAIQSEISGLSASITLSSFAVITQIEYEPIFREGNLSIKVPGIVYDEGKDTIGVAYVTSVCCRGKLDMTRGMESGACHATLDTVALHLTRDFFDYIQSLKGMLTRLRSARMTQLENPPLIKLPESQHAATATDGSMGEFVALSLSNSAAYNPTRQNLFVDGTRVIQGVTSINVVRLELIDVTREVRLMRVHTDFTNLVEIHKPSAKFIAKIPTRRHVPFMNHQNTNSLLILPSPPIRMRGLSRVNVSHSPSEFHRERYSSVEFIGEVDSFRVRCFPSILHVIGAAKGKAVPSSMVERPASMPRLVQDLLVPPDKVGEKSKILVAYKGSFTVHKLDLSMMHSVSNYLQFQGKNFVGCGNSRTELVSSRECVQTHVLTGAISARLQARLRALARRARERAPKSSSAAPPSVTSQLHLRRSAFFFAESLILQYVADPMLPAAVSPSPSAQREENSRVLVAHATRVALGMHEAEQNKPEQLDSGEMQDDGTGAANISPPGVQFDLQVEISEVGIEFPHRPRATDTVYPQMRQWMRAWLAARRLLRSMRYVDTPLSASFASFGQTVFPPSPQPQSAQRQLRAYCCAMQVRNIRLDAGLPQDTSVALNFPLSSAFITASSDKRLALKAHLHPFTFTSGSPTVVRQTAELPSVYLIYAEDEVRRTGTCLMETVEITVSPSIIGHVILTFGRFLDVKESFAKPIPVDDYDESQQQEEQDVQPVRQSSGSIDYEGSEDSAAQKAPTQSMTKLNVSPTTNTLSVKRKGRLLFLLQGIRVSYLTSMTNLRFSVRKLNAVGEMASADEHRTARLVVNVSNAQVALVDREDHDQHQATMRTVRVAQSESSVPSTKAAAPHPLQSNASLSDDDTMQAIRPLGGFIWGLVETSFTLSSGRMDRSDMRATVESIALRSFGVTVDTADFREFENIGKTATWWNLSIFSPLVILRIGLVPLLQRCIDETRELAKRVKIVTERESRFFRRQLSKSHAFKRLELARKKMDAMVERSQQQQLLDRLKDISVHVANKGGSFVVRRSSFSSPSPPSACIRGGTNLEMDEDPADIMMDRFAATKENKFIASMTNFLVVVPFGDAAYRSVLEDPIDFLPSNKSDPQDGPVGGSPMVVLDRSRFIPTMALKVKVENANFLCSLHSSQSGIPVIQSAQANGSFAGFLGPTVESVTTRTKLTARFSLDDVHFYCSDGSPLGQNANAANLIGSTQILGGLGTLTSFDRSEYRNSLCKVHCKSIEVPLHMTKRLSEVRLNALADLAAPQVTVSTRFVSILSQLTQEMSSRQLPPMAQFPISASNRPVSSTPPKIPQSPRSRTARFVDPMNPLVGNTKATPSSPTSPQEKKKKPMRYHFDFTARMDRGEVRVFSLQKDMTSDATTSVDGFPVKVSRTQWRRVRFSSEDPNERPMRSSTRSSTRNHMAILLSIPIPEIYGSSVAYFGGSEDDGDDVVILRLELRASTIEIGPSIMFLAREIEEWATVHDRDSSERVSNIMKMLQEWGEDVSVRNMAVLHSSVADVALPVPQAFADTLCALRMSASVAAARARPSRGAGVGSPDSKVSFQSTHNSLLRSKRSFRVAGSPLVKPTLAATATAAAAKTRKTAQFDLGSRTGSEGGQGDTSVGSPLSLDVYKKKRKKNSFQNVHICVTGFRIVLTTEPAAAVSLSVFLDERGGRVDLFVNRVTGQATSSFRTRSFLKEPDASVVLSVRCVRVECQAKLEVKSLEMYLPELEMSAAVRHRKSWTLQSICAHLPFDVSADTELDLTVRAQHISQIFIVQELWHKTLCELLRSIRQMFARGAPAQIITENVKQNVIGTRRSASAGLAGGNIHIPPVNSKVDKSIVVVVTALRGRVRLDMGSGNTQQVSLAGVSLLLEQTTPAVGAARKVRFDAVVRSLTLRSEGVLSGIASLESVFFKGFLIENHEGSLVFVRSPAQRTFREVLCAQKLRVSFKERQLKDVFECSVAEFCVNLMDGVGEEDYTTMMAEFFLYKCNFVVTPSTVPAFLNTVRSFSEIVAAQRGVAATRLDINATQKSDTSLSRRVREAVRDITRILVSRNSNTLEGSLSMAAGPTFKSKVLQSSLVSPPWLTASESMDPLFAFLGNPLSRVPCGEIQIRLEQTTLVLGDASGNGMGASGGCLVANFPRAALSFAECPSEEYSAVKKFLVIDAYNMELYRPGTVRVLILGFRGANKFEFYTRQKLNDSEVGFALSLHQANPWTGNPRFQDFQELIQLVRSFTAKSNAEVFQRFGKVSTPEEQVWRDATSNSAISTQKSTASATKTAARTVTGEGNAASGDGSKIRSTSSTVSTALTSAEAANAAVTEKNQVEATTTSPSAEVEPQSHDERRLKPLRYVKFSPQLRFGGDVAVNVDVILNWLGITEKMLPYIFHVKVCDKMEKLLARISEKTSERVRSKS